MDKDMRNEAPKDFPPKREFETHGGPPDKSWPKHPWHRRSLKDEDVFPADDGSNPEDRRKVIRARKIATLGAAVIFILGLAITGELSRSPDMGISDQEATQVMSELNAAESSGTLGLAEAIETEAAIPQTEISEEEKAELISQGEDSMKDQIFGDDEDQGISPYLTITGMTDKEKRDAGFVETDFLREAGLFLKDRGISTKRIIVEKEVECSLPKGMAFQGRLEKVDGKSFRFILFPNLPGQYIFMIEEDEKEVQPETLTTEDASEADNQSAGSQTQAASQAQYPLQVQPQSQTQEQADDYDARNISISSVPEELLNYMDNRYVFQYSLYDYLYRNGRKDISSARVTDYSIDSVERMALIRMELSDGSNLSANYDKASGAYSFS